MITLKRRKLTFNWHRKLSYWLMLSPFLAGFVFVFAGVYVNSLRYSFMDVRLLDSGGFEQTWIGFGNYIHLFRTDPDYLWGIQASVVDMFMSVLFITIFSLFIAVLLDRKMPGRAFFRAMFFIPVILATGFIARADSWKLVTNTITASLGSESGAASVDGGLFSRLDVTRLLFALKFSPVLIGVITIAANRIVDIINGSGIQILIFLAGLQSISPQIYESANMDGASGWEIFWLITFPMITPLVLVNAVYTIINYLTMSTNGLMLRIENYRLRVGGMGVASAMAWFYFLVVLACIGIAALVLSRIVFYQQKGTR
jgi:ABC-type sugar transport system permease subunit